MSYYDPPIPPPSIFGRLNAQVGKDKCRGFTLVEMLIVIVIIGILATALIPRLTGVRQRAHDINMEKSVRDLQQALMLYHIDHGAYPGEDMPNCSPHTADDTCYNYASLCGHDDPTTNELEEHVRWNRLMETLSPYLRSDFSMTQQQWPYCVYYFTPSYSRCAKDDTGYTLLFATKTTQLHQYEHIPTIDTEQGIKARYCAYPLE